MKLLIRGGRVADPTNGIDGINDVLVENRGIAAVGHDVADTLGDDDDFQFIDATGKVVCPGFIDAHVHLREPGFEEKEDLASGTRAAALGGFTAVAAMPNTEPKVDSAGMVRSIKALAAEKAVARVYPIACITKGAKGEELTEVADLVEAGAVALSDDGEPVANPQVMRLALQYASMFDIPVIAHCEDRGLSGQGVMNYGRLSTILGLVGIPAEAEEAMLARDLLLALNTGARLHIAHLSTKRGLELVRWARESGGRVTVEVTPHHLILSEEAVHTSQYDTNTKVSPPLRTKTDLVALGQALAGELDLIATDHAPHHQDDKKVEYNYAPFGISGLDTAVPMIITEFIEPGLLTWSQMVEKMSVNPASLLGVDGGSLTPGAPADITIIDPELEYVIDPATFASKGKNTPFAGKEVKGDVYATIVDGRPVVLRYQLVD